MPTPPPTTKMFFVLLFAVFLAANATAYAQNKTIDSLIIALDKEKSPVEKIPILRKLSISFTAVDPDKKYVYARQMRDIAEQYKIDSIIPIAYLDIAMVHGIKTNYDSSMYYFTKGLRLAIEKKVPNQEARAYVGIGYTFDRLDNPKEAIKNYQLALKIFKKLNHARGLNQTIINLGSLYYDLNEYKIAESYFRQALKSFEEMKDEAGIAYGNFILGNASRAQNKDADAFVYYRKSLAIREKLGDVNGIALANFGLGELYLKEGKYDDGKRVLKIAIDNNRTLNNKYQETVALITLTRIFVAEKDIPNALKNAQTAYKNAKAVNSMGLTIQALGELIEIKQLTKEYKKAFEYQSEVIALNDSLDLEKVKKEFMFTDFQRIRTENTTLEKDNKVILSKNLSYKKAIYIITSLLVIVLLLLFLYLRKIAQKNKINHVLQQQKIEISSINSELESLNEELVVQNEITTNQKVELERINGVKNKFFSIVSHDLRSPIATLKMLFNSYFSGHLTQEEMNSLLKKLEENIFSTADFLDNLLEWSKSQLEGMVVNPEVFLIRTLAERNLKILNTQIVEKNLAIENHIYESTSVFADKNMLNVVLRNLLSNSIKFCKQGDSIILRSKIEDNFVLISIKDSGIGIPIEEQKKIFKLEHTISQGTSGEKGHHIGLVLCKDMMEQNNGEIGFESEEGLGTTFFIKIPREQPVT